MASPELTLVDKENSRSAVWQYFAYEADAEGKAKDLQKVLQNGDNKRREHYKFGKTYEGPAQRLERGNVALKCNKCTVIVINEKPSGLWLRRCDADELRTLR